MERRGAPPSCILYQSDSKSVVCLDIPRSIEEAQSPRGESTTRRLYSNVPLSIPYKTPDAKHAEDQSAASTPSAQLALLMTGAAVQGALEHLQEHFPGPYCSPRVTRPPPAPAAEPAAAYFTPKGSRALHGSIQETAVEFASTAPLFDLIVMDPPWPNRSAKRKRGGYSTCHGHEDTRQLLSLIPVPTHLAPDGIVAVWVTNSPSATDVLVGRDGLFSQWGMEVVAEWIWLKATVSGEPMFDPESTWRKPWERLLIAQRKGDDARSVMDKKVIVAVPDVHSRKPNLRCLFDAVLDPGYQALEVFARHLTAGWWAWGDEVTMFQAESHWTTYEEDIDPENAIEET